MKLNVITEPNPILHQVAKPVDFVKTDKSALKKLIHNMIETMYAHDGVGFAAPQAGVPLQLCVFAKNYSFDGQKELVLINPKWEKLSIAKNTDTEGCLSVPNMYGEVKRYKKIKVRAQDINGQPLEFYTDTFLARIVQHEIDHLNGVLFTEKAKNLKKITRA